MSFWQSFLSLLSPDITSNVTRTAFAVYKKVMALTVAKKVRRAGSGTDERVKSVPKSPGSKYRAAVAALHYCASTEMGEREDSQHP